MTSRAEKSAAGVHLPLARRSYDQIKDDILAHRLLPREPLVEAQLAARYGVSKTPVWEAMLMLAREGIVEANTSRGWRVRDFTAKDAREIFELREILEPLALQQAVPLMADNDLSHLETILKQARSAIETDDHRELSRLSRAFRSGLAIRCENSLIVETLNRLQTQVRVMTLRFWRAQATYLEEATQHEAILAAAKDRDAELAAERLRTHISEFKSKYARQWERL